MGTKVSEAGRKRSKKPHKTQENVEKLQFRLLMPASNKGKRDGTKEEVAMQALTLASTLPTGKPSMERAEMKTNERSTTQPTYSGKPTKEGKGSQSKEGLGTARPLTSRHNEKGKGRIREGERVNGP